MPKSQDASRSTGNVKVCAQVEREEDKQGSLTRVHKQRQPSVSVNLLAGTMKPQKEEWKAERRHTQRYEMSNHSSWGHSHSPRQTPSV